MNGLCFKYGLLINFLLINLLISTSLADVLSQKNASTYQLQRLPGFFRFSFDHVSMPKNNPPMGLL